MGETPLAELRVSGPLELALERHTLVLLEGDRLKRFLMGRRWFGGKGAEPRGVRVREVIPLFEGSAVARLEVEPASVGSVSYQLPLAVRRGDPDGLTAVLARVESATGRGVLFDAAEDAGFRERLGRAFAGGAEFAAGGCRWIVSAAGRPFLAPRLAGAEQSNTSIFFGDDAMLKLYRRLATGENPDCEIGKRLTEIGFRHVPALLGTIYFQRPDGLRSLAGLLQALVPAEGDGWSHALARFRHEVCERSEEGRTFAVEAGRLGGITRELHEALASFAEDPDFAPAPVTQEDLAEWRARVGGQVERALALLATFARSGRAREAGVERSVEGCLARRQHVLARIAALVDSLEGKAGARIRHHGDFHLGQVLPTRSGDFVIIDFEGEPARPLAERRERKSPLRDVAGMLRSFGYAASVGVRQASEDGTPIEPAELERRARRWEEVARGEFTKGYLAKQPLAAFLPPTRPAVEDGIALFELEKVFYELEYELDNRPEWVGVPLAGVERLLASG